MYTGVAAVTSGAEQWLWKYYWNIHDFCFGNPNYTYYSYLPNYGYTQVTAYKLASMMYYDGSMGLTDVTSEMFTKIQNALQADHDLNNAAYAANSYTDPYYDWKWRSVFMEGRHAENGSSTPINANCWGNANYLTQSWEWYNGYAYYRNQALGFGQSTAGASFPHIYLDGGDYRAYGSSPNPYSIDRDFKSPTSLFTYRGYGANTNPNSFLNSFDVIRMAYPPTGTNAMNWEMTPPGSSLNLGENVHSAVYITTDESGVGWMYQKGNYGATSYAPYDLHWVGDALGSWQYGNNCPRSYFHHNSGYKGNLATSYNINWGSL
jgi:hypothetical protein